MARYSPALPLIGGGTTKFQPVFVGDVAEAIARSVDGEVKGGQVYELGGPNVLSFRQCMEQMLEVIDRKRLLVPVPWWLASDPGRGPRPAAQAAADTRPGDAAQDRQCRLARSRGGRPHLAGLGIQPQSTAAILPTYLWRYRAAGQFSHKTEA